MGDSIIGGSRGSAGRVCDGPFGGRFRRSVAWRIGVLVLLGIVLAAPSLLAQPPAGSSAPPVTFAAQYQRAMELYKAERFPEAIAAFEAAYAIDKDPKLLINIGRAHHRLGHPVEAIASYARFLQEDTSRDAAVAARVKAYIEESRAQLSNPSAKPAPSTQTQTQTQTEKAPVGAPEGTGARPANLAAPMPRSEQTPSQIEPAKPQGIVAAHPVGASPEKTSGADSSGLKETSEKKPIYKRWWFWTGIGGVAAAAIIIPTTIVVTQQSGSPSVNPPAGLDVRMVQF